VSASRNAGLTVQRARKENADDDDDDDATCDRQHLSPPAVDNHAGRDAVCEVQACSLASRIISG